MTIIFTVGQHIPNDTYQFTYDCYDCFIPSLLCKGFLSGRNVRGVSYDAAGNPLKLTYPNGTHIDYTPDVSLNRTDDMKYINNAVSGHDVLLDDVNYSYDNMNNVTGIHSLTGNKEYIYDTMNRLTTVNNKNKAGDTLLEYTGYSYNGAGYRAGVDNNGTTQDSYGYYTDSDRLQTVSGKALMYDDGGNERSDGTNNYFHDDMNMLTQVMIGGTNGSIMYSYDLENRLKTRRNTNGNILDIYFYDGRDIVMEKDSAGNINSLYVRGPGGEMLKEKRRYTNTSGSFTTKYYYYPDRIGSVYMVCDDHGMLLEKENADAFGNSKTVGISKYGLTSNIFDTDTGLYYFHARWYDGKIGRFLEMDPVLSETGLINMYEYCANNPASLTDRDGKNPILLALLSIFIWELTHPQNTVDIPVTDNSGHKINNEGEKNYDQGDKGAFDTAKTAVDAVTGEEIASTQQKMAGYNMSGGSIERAKIAGITKASIITTAIITTAQISGIWADEGLNFEGKINLTGRAVATTAAGVVVGAVGGVVGGIATKNPYMIGTIGVESGSLAEEGMSSFFDSVNINYQNRKFHNE
jgi:RHS repeat-associated protein